MGRLIVSEPAMTDRHTIFRGGGFRAVRGGSWDFHPWALRADVRFKDRHDRIGNYRGFRIVEDMPGRNRVIRGGSWFNVSWLLRSANRNWIEPDFRLYYLGFRVVEDL